MFFGIEFDDADTHVNTQLRQCAVFLLGGEFCCQKVENRFEEGLNNRFQVDVEEIRQHFETFLVEVVIKEFF